MSTGVLESSPQTDLAIEQLDILPIAPQISLEDFLQHPLEDAEWVDGQIVEKVAMGIVHGRTQAEFAALLLAFVRANQSGGIVCTEVLCRTQNQARKPDVAYMSAQQVAVYGATDFTMLPECFPLVIEIISPTDLAEDVFFKAKEYLDAGAEEAWLIFPKNRLIMIATLESAGDGLAVRWNIFASQELASSSKVLPGFSVNVYELLPVYASQS